MIRCAPCGWIVTDEYVDQIATMTERATRFRPGLVFVRCPECWVPILEPLNVDEARKRIHHAHDDLGDGGVCTQCGRLHTATIVPSCERCGGPDYSTAPGGPGHHHCPPVALVTFDRTAS